MLITIGCIALVVRAVFIFAVIRISSGEFRPLEGNDTPEYLRLARNFVEHGTYVSDNVRSRLEGLYRTPAYPLYCATIMKLGGGNRAIVWSQAPIGAASCVLIAWLALQFFGSRALAWIAGLLGAFSPTGISLTSMILVEAWFGFTMIAGFCCMYIAATRGSSRAALAAGASWGLAGLIKPTLLGWPLVGIAVWVLIARANAQRVRWRDVLLCSAIQAAVLLGWSLRNYRAEGYFSPSAVGARNLRMLFVPMLEEWHKAGHEPARRDYTRNYVQTAERQKQYLSSRGVTAAKFVRMQMRESRRAIRAHPLLALRVYMFNLLDELITGWNLVDPRLYYDYVHEQRALAAAAATQRKESPHAALMRRRREAAVSEAAIRAKEPFIWKMYKPLGWISMSPICQWLWASAAAASALTIWLVPRGMRGPHWRQRALIVAALWITLIYFAAFAGTVFRAGSRLMYPAEFAVILLILSNIPSLVEMIRAHSARRAACPSDC